MTSVAESSRRTIEPVLRYVGSSIGAATVLIAAFHLLFILTYRVFLWTTTGHLYWDFAPTRIGGANAVLAAVELCAAVTAGAMLVISDFLRRTARSA